MKNICDGCSHKKVCMHSEVHAQIAENLAKDFNGRFKNINSEIFVFCSLSTNTEYKQSNSSDCTTCAHKDLCKIYLSYRSLTRKALNTYSNHLKASLFCSEYVLDDKKEMNKLIKGELELIGINKKLNDADPLIRRAAVNAFEGREVPLEWIEKALRDENHVVRRVAVNACKGREVPLKWIEKALNDENCSVRYAAVEAFEGREVPLEWIKKALNDENYTVRYAAVNACKEREVPLGWIEKALNDENCSVRYAAVEAFEEREVPLGWIEKALNDENYMVRYAAVNACKEGKYLWDGLRRL